MTTHRLFAGLICTFVSLATLMAAPLYAQNLLVNGGFETTANPGLGFNPGGEIPPWRSSNVPAGIGPNDIASNSHFLIQVDGPGGYQNGSFFPESDASASGGGVAQQYLQLQRYAWQYVTPSCDGTLSFSVKAARLGGNGYDFGVGNAISIVPVPSEVGYLSSMGYYPTSDTQKIVDLIALHDGSKTGVVLPSGQPLTNAWFPFSTQAPVQTGQAYAVVIEGASVPSAVAFDNAEAVLSCPPDEISPQDVTLTKTCEPPVPHSNNGVLGQLWECRVEVSVSQQPFSEDILLHDLFTNTALVDGQVLLGESASGNGSCFQGDCMISGANFDSSGTEYFDFDIFVEATDTADVYPLGNCATGEIDNGSGTLLPLSQSCTTDQWIPRSEVVKTCDPIPAGATAPYTMNCQIQVSASNLVGGTYVSVTDAFVAQPPSIATVTPTFMNMTSSENWDCIDHSLTPPSAIGICELPADDLMAAGGTSTLNISFDFDVDHAPTQVANCRFTDIHDSSYLAHLSGQRGAVRSPIQSGGQTGGWPQMPDGCVYVDVPDTDKQDPELDVKKTCKPVGDRQILSDSAWFQQWQCTITVTSNGVPFNAPIWVGEDMLYGPNNGAVSIISMSSNDPWQCTQPVYGAGNQPYCGMDPTLFPYAAGQSTINVTLNLAGAAADQFGAENCVSVTTGKTPSDDPADVLAEDCFEILPTPDPKKPDIDLVKTCALAQPAANGQWTVACTLTITGQNLPAGEPLRVVDELMSSATQTALFGHMNAPTNACGAFPISGGTAGGCDLTTDDIINAGGTLVIPYTGTYQGPGGRPLNGAQAQNCAYVDVPGLNLHGPQSGNGKSCVPVEFKLEATTGVLDVLIDPETPDIDGPVIVGDPIDATAGVGTLPALPQKLSLNKTCDPLVFAGAAQTTTATCAITASVPSGANIQIDSLSDMTSVPFSQYNVAQVANPVLSGRPNMGCAVVIGGFGIPSTDCTGPAIADMAAGGQFTFDWTAQIGRPPTDQVTYRNCAHLRYLNLDTGQPNTLEACSDFDITVEGGKSQGEDTTPAPTPPPLTDPVVEPSLKLTKTQTSDCVANRNTQRYTCGFRITVTNEGNAPFNGPLVVTDTFGSPWAQTITQTSQGGWFCAQPVGGAVSCEHSGLNLPAGSFAYIDLDMQVQGLVNGGRWENCAAVGIPNDRKQRVAAIQQVMNARGLAAGPVDGLPGNKTYAALAELQKSLGLPESREIDDTLFRALGLPLAKPGEKACVTAELPPMPKPPLQCERATTVQNDEACACRYDNMVRRNATACQCRSGYAFVRGEGCVEQVVPQAPTPAPAELVCDRRSTISHDGECVCIDQVNAVKTSSSTCGCKNGLPMVSGRCLPIAITLGTEGADTPDHPAGTEDLETCRLRLNGICIK